MNQQPHKRMEPLVDSLFILAFQLFLILFLSSLAYLLIDIFFLQATVSFDYHHHVNLLLLSIHVIKSIVQIVLVMLVLVHWLFHKYYVDCVNKKLIERKGLLHIQENCFDLKNIREVKIRQGIFGKLFHYGDVFLTTSASGGYQATIRLRKIQNPHESMDILKSCL